MNDISLSRSSSVPLHAQISQILVRLIENGKLAHGEMLPPERYLAELFGVSLAPVRQAILYAIGFCIISYFPISRTVHQENLRRLAAEASEAGYVAP